MITAMILLLPGSYISADIPDPPNQSELKKPLLTYYLDDCIEISGGLIADVGTHAAIYWDYDYDNGILSPQEFPLSTTGGSGVSWLQGINAHAYCEWYYSQDDDWFNTAESEVENAASELSACATYNSLNVVGSIIAPLYTRTEDGELPETECSGMDYTISSAEANLKTDAHTITIPFIVLDDCNMFGSVNIAMLGGAPPDIDYETYSEVSLTIYKGNTIVAYRIIELDDIGGDTKVFSSFVASSPDYLLEATFYADHSTSSSAGCDDQGPNGGQVLFEDIFSINVHFNAIPDEGTSQVDQ
jgi:hypothetical protein